MRTTAPCETGAVGGRRTCQNDASLTMAMGEADDDLATGSPHSGPKTAPMDNASSATHGSKEQDGSAGTAGPDQKETANTKGVPESPPRSPDAKSAKESSKEKADDEKDVVLDMSTTIEVPLRDTTPAASPIPPPTGPNAADLDAIEDYPSFHRRMFVRLVGILFAQWLIVLLGAVASAMTNYTFSYLNPTYIVLTLLFVAIFAGHLAYLSLTSANMAPSSGRGGGSSNSNNAIDKQRLDACTLHVRVANLAKLLTLTLTLCGLFYALTGCFSMVCFNVVASAVFLTLAGALVFVAVLPRRVPSVLELLNGSLVATTLALVIVGSVFSNDFRYNWDRSHPLVLAASTLAGLAIAIWFLLGVVRTLDDEANAKTVQLDFGVSFILGIYADGINSVWKAAVGRDALGLPSAELTSKLPMH